MNKRQTTLKEAIEIKGNGLHTGIDVNLRILPAKANSGYRFKRTDLDGQPETQALADYVVDTSRGTTIENNGCRIATSEHVLAALAGMEVDNATIEMDAIETPIMDGSSYPFVEAIKSVGIQELDKDKDYFNITSNINYEDKKNGVEITALPFNDYRLTVMVDYNSPVLGSQHSSIASLKDFEKEISPCRTFCFLHELEALVANDLIKGGDLNNAIVVVDRVVSDEEMQNLAKLFNKPKVEVKKEGILNNLDLRFQNEPARHKLLDLIGDLALIGKPINAHIVATRPGHYSNVEFAKKIIRHIKSQKGKNSIIDYNPNIEPIYSHKELMEILPHKFPFLLIDKVVGLTEKEVIAVKNISGDESFFQGHFPNEPILPGVLQLEIMAQTGGVLVLHDKEKPKEWSTYFLKIENAKFKDKVVPGDTLLLRLELVSPVRRGICFMRGEAYVGNKLVCTAEMTAQIVHNKKSVK